MIKMDEARLRKWEAEAKEIDKKARKKDIIGWGLFGLGAFIMGGGIGYLQEAAWHKGTSAQSRYSMDLYKKEQGMS